MPIYHKKVALAPFQNVAPDGRIGTLIRPFP
jgi:hypothetical protein